jgi:hypothetical protein
MSSPLHAIQDMLANERLRSTTTQDVAEVESVRAQRLHVLDDIFKAFNVCDVDLLYKLLKARCCEDVAFLTAGVSSEVIGFMALFSCWSLAHETYPDAMVTILERRVSSDPMSQSVSQRLSTVEIVFKFVGTRITSRTMVEVYSKFIETQSCENNTYEELSLAMVRFVTNNSNNNNTPDVAESEISRTLIMETRLDFDPISGLISRWTVSNLAGFEM